jgi:hypothetical protein
MNPLLNSQFFGRLMRGIEYLMAGLFLLLVYKFLRDGHWIRALGLFVGSLVLASNLQSCVKIPVMLSLIVLVEIALKS